jgi:hypothetical protein
MGKVFDNAQAFREGWGLFMCDDGLLRVQRLDDPQSGAAYDPKRKWTVQRSSKGRMMSAIANRDSMAESGYADAESSVLEVTGQA